MMRTIHLHGRLKKEFGPSFRFDVATEGEALRALNCAFPVTFIRALEQGSFTLVRGDRRSGMKLDLDLVCGFNLGLADLHLMPVAAGKGNGKGVAKTILGAALIGAAIFMAPAGGVGFLGLGSTAFPLLGTSVTWGNIALIGLGVALSGASTLLTKTDSKETVKDDSFTLGGPNNSARQGDAIPLIYGEVIVGSVNVSFDADIEDIGAYQGQTGSLGDSVQATKSGIIGGVTL